MGTITGANGNELHYEDTGGAGRPVVLVHGWPLNGQAWKNQVGPLTQAGHRVITYDRRGFGQSEPQHPYTYDALAGDLAAVIEALNLRDAVLVGFSMGGGEVARYLAQHGSERVASAIFAAAVTPYLLHTSSNPEGPLKKTEAAAMAAQLTANREKFFDGFTTDFFSAGEALCVSEAQRQEAIRMCLQANKLAALECMASFGATDFRDDLDRVTIPTLVIHGDADGVVPFEGSGQRTHQAVPDSELVVVPGAPHGLNVSHAEEFNAALLGFLSR
ncbi:alpha/beta hydrolase [Citricoccus sp.]|uniref:alpha/beta fold hydrolase n=1 Tax=Citricoccus sp. TaxID=1978372 RepID=UPI0028BE2431|nr:alpha/beta hydrolase [Citricoccus sp.]